RSGVRESPQYCGWNQEGMLRAGRWGQPAVLTGGMESRCGAQADVRRIEERPLRGQQHLEEWPAVSIDPKAQAGKAIIELTPIGRNTGRVCRGGRRDGCPHG